MSSTAIKTPLVFAMTLFAGNAFADAQRFFPEWPALLQTEVLKLSKSFDGEAMFYVKDLQSGVRYTYNAATPTYIASGVKLTFMVGLFKLISEGRATLDEEMIYGTNDVRDGSPVFNYLKVGTAVPLTVVLEAMVHQSDNAASDMIVRRVGIENINRTLVDEGLEGFGPITSLLDVRRLVYKLLDPRVEHLTPEAIRAIGVARSNEDRALRLTDALGEMPGTYSLPDIDRAFRDYYRAGYNSATMEAVGDLLERLATGHLISTEASQAMVEVMLGTITGQTRIPGRLPPGVPVAHKTGTQYQRICDLGIIYVGDDHPVVLAACTKGGSKKHAEELIAGVARKLYDLLAPEGPLRANLNAPRSDGFLVGTSSITEIEEPALVAPPKATKKRPPKKQQK